MLELITDGIAKFSIATGGIGMLEQRTDDVIVLSEPKFGVNTVVVVHAIVYFASAPYRSHVCVNLKNCGMRNVRF